MNADQILLSADKLGALHVWLANEFSGGAANVRTVYLGHYHYKEVCMTVVRISDQISLLGGIQRCCDQHLNSWIPALPFTTATKSIIAT